MMLDIARLAKANPLLEGDGLISIQEAARAIGLSERSLLEELLNERTELVTHAQHWQGWHVTNIDDVERDYDETFILNDVEERGQPKVLAGPVSAFDSRSCISSLMSDGSATESIFRLTGTSAFFALQEISIPLTAWMTPKSAIEAIRARLAKAVPQDDLLKKSAPASPLLPAGPVITDAITVNHGHKKFSELFELYREHRRWGADQAQKMAKEASLFIELMNDPELSKIDLSMVHEYGRRLALLPSNIYLARRRMKDDSMPLSNLIANAEHIGMPLKGESTVVGHVGRLSEILGFACRQAMVHANPASDFRRKWGTERLGRAQDDHDAFTSDELGLIFSQEWFAKGRGRFSENGQTTNWRPHFFWLPLLGLTTGGRRNELAQLYLDDICLGEDGKTWYLDFNLEQPDKLDVDGSELAQDKSLKTINAIRVVPLHDAVIQAGLPEYVTALRKAGHTRLFPELKRDAVKGYGKPAGSWFNERFLGKQLGIERNGRKTFHSLRHNFITSLERLDLPERVMAQLAGHERGKTQSARRYAKDRSAAMLKPMIDRLSFECLNGLGRFHVQSGIQAIKAALRRKVAKRPKT